MLSLASSQTTCWVFSVSIYENSVVKITTLSGVEDLNGTV